MQQEKDCFSLIRRIVCTLCFLAFQTSVLAAEELLLLEPEFRTDLQSGFSDDHSKNNSSSGTTTQFVVNRAHLNLRGAVSPKIDYHMRVRWNRDFQQQKDNTSLGLEYWYLRHHFSELMQFRIGKQFVLQGGIEGSKNPIDVFHYSHIGNRLKDLYTVGASLLLNLKQAMPEIKEQTLILQLLNQIPSGNQNQYAMSYNLAWYGEFIDGNFKPVIQYGFFPSAEEFRLDSENEKVQTKEAFTSRVYSIGASLKTQNGVIDFDFLNRQQDAYKELNDKDEIINHDSEQEDSIVVKAQHQGQRFQPFVKWSIDAIQLEKREEFNSSTIGVEIFPFDDLKGYRLHGFFSKQERLLNTEKIGSTLLNIGVSLRF